MINRVFIQGKLGKDPELTTTPAGHSICKFSLANSQKYKGKETVLWVNAVAWGKIGEIIAQYVVKGQELIVEGRIQDASWSKNGIKHYAWNLVVDNFSFCGNPPKPKKDDDADLSF